jgi:hypothetical protein
VVILVIVGPLLFLPLILHPTAVLYSDYSDFINYHIPVKSFLVRSVQQTGELPLWCPEMFAGMPFVHDPQVAAFYPAHLPLYLVPVQHMGAACSWLIVLHVMAAGLCMYAYARHRGLGRAGSLIAGLGYMLAGKWLFHLLVAGHFNVAPLAWLPLLLLWLEQAIMRGCVLRAIAAGVVFACIILGTHPQLTFYTAIFAGVWVAGIAPAAGQETATLADKPRPATLRRFAWVSAILGTVAGLLAAVQIWPAMEATAASSRTLGVGVSSSTLLGGIRTLIGLIGPPLTTDSSWLWEDRGGFGLVWLALAACAPMVDSRRWVRIAGVLTLLWFFLGLGGVALVQWVPGFHLWRLPSRMLMLAALPVALLAGTTVDALLAGPTPELCERCRNLLVKAAVFVLVPLGIFALIQYRKGSHLVFVVYWPSLLATVPLAWWLLGKGAALPAAAIAKDGPREGGSRPLQTGWGLAAGWVAVLLIELAAIAGPLVRVYPEADLFAPSASVAYLHERAGERGRVLDISPINPANPDDRAAACATPLWPNLAMIAGVEPVRGYNPLDVLRYKEYLQFVMNSDEPLRALHNLTQPGPGGFPIENATLANLLGIRFLLLPSEVPLDWFVTDARARAASWKAVEEDAAPRAYSFVPTTAESLDAGVLSLPRYTVHENRDAFPRAFYVAEAKPLPDRDRLLAELKKTDFRQCVLLEGWDGTNGEGDKQASSSASAATIRHYTPNRVVIDVHAAAPGFLVLADPWFPGWTCTVNGQPVAIHRANFLFRAVAVPAGASEVVFRFAPRSYEWGKIISLATLALVVLVLAGGVVWQRVVGSRQAASDGQATGQS